MAGEGVGVGGTYVTRSSFDSTSDKHISSMKNNKQNIWKGNKFPPFEPPHYSASFINI